MRCRPRQLRTIQSAAGVLWIAVATCGVPQQSENASVSIVGPVGDQIQPSLATAVDRTGAVWVVAGYTNIDTSTNGSAMGLSIRSPRGTWQTYPPLEPRSRTFQPSGDAWLATAQNGSRVYYASLATDSDDPQNGVGDGLALATIDVADGDPVITPPMRITVPDEFQWDEPTVAVTRPPDATDDTVIVAGTPILPDSQDAIGIVTSVDGGRRFGPLQLVHAPEYPGAAHGTPDNTVVRPVLQQDPRPGHECHAFLAFGVYYATALIDTPGVRPPACIYGEAGCRSIAESESFDCGLSWSDAVFIAVDTRPPLAPDYRGFAYAVANDGTRMVMFPATVGDDAVMLFKRAAPQTTFSVMTTARGMTSWDDGPIESIVERSTQTNGGVRFSRPALVAGSVFGAVWVEEDSASHLSSVCDSFSTPSATGVWTATTHVDPETDGTACDSLPSPLDNYMGVTSFAGFGRPNASFLAAWTAFAPCHSATPHHIVIGWIR